MKLAELKSRFQNRYVIRVVAGVLVVALAGSGTVYAKKAAATDTDRIGTEAIETESLAADEDLETSDSLNLENMIATGDSQAGKEETVYLISDADGTVNQTIVMEHLVNDNKEAALEDATTLSDIQNVKGNETFSQDGQKLTWQADGNDIYYRGTSQEQAPVTQKVSYYLDGKETTPKELAGKSGKVTIRFDYENHTIYTEEVNGEIIEVKVPFACVTGLVLDDSFSNIQVSNGKIKQNGEKHIVMGYALPGLAESLKADESDFTESTEFPEYFEVTADVENFSLSTAMTFVVNATDYTSIEGIDTSDLDERIAELSDASGQLEDGSKELSAGLDTLKDSLGDFSAGMKELSSGLTDYTDGARQVNGGILQVKDGVDLLAGSKDALADGISRLKDGSASAVEGADALVSGCDSLYSGTQKLNSGASDLADGASTLASGASDLASGASEVDTGASALAAGASDLVSGVADLSAGVKQVDSGASELAGGASALADGAAQLDDGVDLLVDTLGEMSRQLSDSEAAILAQFQTDATKALLAQLDPAYADGVTADNIAKVTRAVAGNEAQLVGTLQVLGYSQAQAQAAYDTLLSGLYQAQGALAVLNTVSEQLGSNASKIQALAQGSESVKNGAAALSEGASQLSQGTSRLSEGTAQLSEGTSRLSKGAAALSEGTSQLRKGAADLSGGAEALNQGASSLSTGVRDLQAGAGQVYDGNKSLAAGLGTLDDGLGSLAEKVPVLVQGITALQDGVNTLADGSNTLISNNVSLLSGMDQLLSGTGQVVDGVDQLDDGSHELADGMQQFNEEAIDKLVNSYNGDVKSLTNRLQAVLDAGKDYQTYTALADGTTGSVKFVYKLASIQEE